MLKWIKFEDSKPTEEGWYLVMKDNYPVLVLMMILENSRIFEEPNGKLVGLNNNRYTHWMRIQLPND